MLNEEMLAALGSDAKLVTYMPTEWKDGEAYDGTKVKMPIEFQPTELPGGQKVIYDNQGNVTLTMPRGGYFYDPCHHPLRDITSVKEIEKAHDAIHTFNLPAWLNKPLDRVAEQAQRLRQEQDRVLIGDFQGHIFMAAQIIRGWTEFMLDLVSNPSMAQALLDALAQAQMKNFDVYAETVGKHLDIIQMCDDLGMQDAPWMSPQIYRSLIKPYHQKLYSHIKKKCPHAYILLHSDGSIYPMIEDLIDVGVDILNPIQYSCKNMELAKLKKEFGKDICFWGAGVDTQQKLPYGSPQEVEDEVKRNIDLLAPGGGFVFATVHNIVEGVPAENVIAAFQTAKEYGKY
jgi:uroporphyrinogen decarboxylase